MLSAETWKILGRTKTGERIEGRERLGAALKKKVEGRKHFEIYKGVEEKK